MSIDPKIESRPTQIKSTQRTRVLKYGLVTLLVLLVIGFFAWRHFHQGAAGTGQAQGWSGRKGGAGLGNKPMPVQARAAVAGDLKVYLNALGNVVPLSSVTVHPRVSGILMSVNFKEGQNVKQGDMLMLIDPRPYQVALTQAEGQLAKDEGSLASARKDLARYQTLIKQDSIAQQTLDDQAALVTQDEGAVKTDQGAVDSAKLNLVYCRVTAPVSGKLGLRLVDPGNVVQTSDANGVVVINQFQPMFVEYTIPEDNLPAVLTQLHQGNQLEVDAWDRGQTVKLATGKLASIDNQIDPTTGTIKIKAVFPNTDENLFPNQFVNIRMLVTTQHNATLLPSAGIQRGAQGTFVFVVAADNTVSARPVTLGPVDGDNVGITSGINPGEQVVIDGADKLKDGAKVQIVVPGAPQAGGQTHGKGQGGHHHRHGGDSSGDSSSGQ